jgi:acetoin utilization deacetylase AcuC-like enzyme
VVAADLEHDEHFPGVSHPERRDRLVAALAGIADAGFGEALATAPLRPATFDEVAAVHDRRYLAGVAELCASGGGRIDADTVVSRGSWATALLTAGAGLVAVETLAAGRGDAAFVLGRPPGHHATADRAMGFCLVNHVAVTAAALAARGERVAIIDWDVHHGNGTQDIFWSDPAVLYLSVHQWPLYPGTGRSDERGGGAGRGTTVNLPMPPGSAGGSYRQLFEEVVVPCVERFAPTWVLISAGFDAHRDDPLAQMSLSAGDFADLARIVGGLAGRNGRTVAFLEGGYELGAVRASVAAAAAALIGERFRPELASSASSEGQGEGRAQVARYRSLFVDEPLVEEAMVYGPLADGGLVDGSAEGN